MGGSGPCYLCAEESGLRCPHCGVWVCGEAHYRHHRLPGARSLPLVSADSLGPLLEDQRCAPFRVQRDADRGRYLVATRDIRPLELVLRWYFIYAMQWQCSIKFFFQRHATGGRAPRPHAARVSGVPGRLGSGTRVLVPHLPRPRAV